MKELTLIDILICISFQQNSSSTIVSKASHTAMVQHGSSTSNDNRTKKKKLKVIVYTFVVHTKGI